LALAVEGGGEEGMKEIDCPYCHGRGFYDDYYVDSEGCPDMQCLPCEACDGTGIIKVKEETK